MKKWIIALVCVVGVITLASAGPQYIAYEVSQGAVATNVLTQTLNPIGYIDEVYLDVPSESSVTSIVTFVSTPNVSATATATVIYTNSAATAAVKARPRVTQTDNTGTSLTNLTVRERFLCNGDPVVFRVDQTSAVTGVTFKAWLKISQE